MTENEARLTRMLAIYDQARAATEEAARDALVSTPADNDEARTFLQDETDLDAVEWHLAHQRTGTNPDEIVGAFITVEHPGGAEMFVRGFEPFELETGYQVYNELTLILPTGSMLRFFDKTVAGNVQNSCSGPRTDY